MEERAVTCSFLARIRFPALYASSARPVSSFAASTPLPARR